MAEPKDTDREIAGTFTLSKPMTIDGDEVSELKFRMPTGIDLIEIGNPVVLDMAADPPRVEHDMPRMAKMMARLCVVAPSTISKMDPQDLVSCAWLLTPFFVPRAGTI